MRMMVVMAVVATALATGCGFVPAGGNRIAVKAEQYPWADVSGYRTYRWWAPAYRENRDGSGTREAVLDWRVRSAVDRELAARGYRPAAAGEKADFVIAYQISVREASTDSVQDYMEYRAEGGTRDMGDAFMGYERGTLMLTITDVATQRVAWRASASAVVGDGKGERVDPAVRDMLQKFPAATG